MLLLRRYCCCCSCWWWCCWCYWSWDPRRWASTTHTEPLTVRISCSFKPAFVFALFGHWWVLSQLLRASVRFAFVFLANFLSVDEVVVVFLIVLTLLTLTLAGLIWAYNTSLAVAQIALPRQLAISWGSGISFKVTFCNFHHGLFGGFDFCHHRIRFIPQVIFICAKSIAVWVFLVFVKEVIWRSCLLLRWPILCLIVSIFTILAKGSLICSNT